MTSTQTPPLWPRDLSMEEAVHLYIDGELPFELQPALFAHLAVDEEARRMLDAVLKFRRMTREDYLPVPPAADEAFFKRLASLQRQHRRIDRAAQRRPIWEHRTPVSFRAAVVAAALLFMAGLLFPVSAGEAAPQGYVVAQVERVELPTELERPSEYVYVFYPGLDVEALKEEATAERTGDPL